MESDLSSASIYTEFSGLKKLKLAAKHDSPEALEEVAKQFEAFFLKMMLKQMRDANLGEGLFESDQTRLYQDMMDQQMALNLSGQKGFGIANSIIKQLAHTVKQTEKSTELKPFSKRVDMNKTMLKLSTDIQSRESNFQTPEDFINTMRPYAEAAAGKLGIPANVLLAQSALETGWGNKVIQHGKGENSHNLFGIKADQQWQGQHVNVSSLEYTNGKAKREFSNFRVYESYKQSFDDYVDFIKSNDRYRSALKSNDNGESYIKALQDAGYATDPQYANKVIDIINREAI
jgi:peptidoglycan hydrolase FlgJ